MAKVLINFSDAQVENLGACKTAADFQAAVDLAIDEMGASKTEQKVVSIEDVKAIFAENSKTFTASLSTVEAAVKAIQADVAKVDPDALVKKAEEAGSKAAAKSLGKVGASGSGAADVNPNDGGAQPDASAGLIAQGKFEEAYAADKNIQAEFSSAAVFAAFKRAESRNSFSVFKPKTK